ncbi:metallophosphatase domain-containing protein [Litoribacillus peritrichatus]|uniref:Calcineurin-like phosphoesterase domain-containing protein n=1 Tax=Litoribacillus peritrichatus TaxID=718191 RepID=A0ABP7MIR7_9GAMM
MRFVVISDTHGMYPKVSVPDGDVLIHCGDILARGRLSEIDTLNGWLESLPHEHKIIIAGNHDRCFQKHQQETLEKLTSAIYLQDSSVVINGLKFYGSPWTPEFYDWYFMLNRRERAEKWKLIEEDTDVLITHGPPFSILDQVLEGEHVGCPELLKRVKEVSPKYHLFGHIHEGYGMVEDGDTTYINASLNNVKYRPVNMPWVLDIS